MRTVPFTHRCSRIIYLKRRVFIILISDKLSPILRFLNVVNIKLLLIKLPLKYILQIDELYTIAVHSL